MNIEHPEPARILPDCVCRHDLLIALKWRRLTLKLWIPRSVPSKINCHVQWRRSGRFGKLIHIHTRDSCGIDCQRTWKQNANISIQFVRAAEKTLKREAHTMCIVYTIHFAFCRSILVWFSIYECNNLCASSRSHTLCVMRPDRIASHLRLSLFLFHFLFCFRSSF